MDSDYLVSYIKKQKSYRGQITNLIKLPSQKPIYSQPQFPLTDQVQEILTKQGIDKLYIHQAQSLNTARDGDSYVVVTPTASGKTLCFNLPVLETIFNNKFAKALYIYPTKALAQDQLGKINSYNSNKIAAYCYDGDTPKDERTYIRQAANIILTNPDMLHYGILPYHNSWMKFFRNLKYVVIDESHYYRGILGSHFANVILRLRRIAAYYGASPQFICSSATVGNPAELVEKLTGIVPKVINMNGSGSSKKSFVFWNPPFVGEQSERRSCNAETVSILTALITNDVRSLVFTKSRKMTELILRFAKGEIASENPSKEDKIMPYRGGYTAKYRREIEKKLFNGDLLGVISTTALELGVDIGGLDAVIMAGYPGSLTGAWQQAGRAGRGDEESIVFLVAMDNPLDQYVVNSPDYFFSENGERIIIDNQNPYVLASHLACAAFEIPLDNAEVEELFGENAYEDLGELAEAGLLNYRNRRWYWNSTTYPAADVNIRSIGSNYDIICIKDKPYLLGTIDESTAFFTVHPGAVYLHAGESYIVNKLDVKEHAAYVMPSEVNYYTTPADITTIGVVEKELSKTVGKAEIHYGKVFVTTTVGRYFRKRLFTDEVIESIPLSLPEQTLNTQALWIEVPPALSDKLMGRDFDLGGTIHAAEHVSIGMMPLFALCDRNDIGGVSHPAHLDVNAHAAIFIYDGYQGGVGLAKAAYDSIEELLETSLKTMQNCKCEDGCPSCVQSPKCGNNNSPLDKDGAIFMLSEILGR